MLRSPACPVAPLYRVLDYGLSETPNNEENLLALLGGQAYSQEKEAGQKAVHSSLETAVNACHQGGLPGGGRLTWTLNNFMHLFSTYLSSLSSVPDLGLQR